jgi:segregation and condensation protein B
MELSLAAKLEAILFWKGEPITTKRLAEIAGISPEDTVAALTELQKNLEGRGVQLIFTEDEVMLGTAAAAGTIIERLVKDELIKDLGKAGLETLAIILYRGPVSRRDIEYIRGVNCSYIIRNLLIRGLVERIEKKEKKDQERQQRGAVYQPTVALLGYLGVSKASDLPEYTQVQQEIAERQKAADAESAPEGQAE